MESVMQEWPRRRRITVEQYHRMADAGLLDSGERVELINGEIVDMPPMGSAHAGVLEQLAALMSAAVPPHAVVRPQLPLRLGEDSEPEPDIAVVRAAEDHYTTAHPTAEDALLVVEISDATLRFDREVKAPLYAAWSIPRVWIVDLAAGRIEVLATPADGRYTHVESIKAPARLEVLPGVALDLSALVGIRPSTE